MLPNFAKLKNKILEFLHIVRKDTEKNHLNNYNPSPSAIFLIVQSTEIIVKI